MILGSKPYKRKCDQTVDSTSSSNDENKVATVKIHGALNTEDSTKTSLREDFENEINSSRRALFTSIIPSIGNGLVKLLRTSNNLKHEFNENFQKQRK